MDFVGQGMPSLPLESTHGVTMSIFACHYRPLTAHKLDDVVRSITSLPLENIYGRTTEGVAFHYGPRTAYTVKRCRTLHVIISFG